MADPAKKAESSNYYRILGTNSNASDELIKERYLEKVRAFPPEKDPEEFKRIRKAYDTLKDPFKRSEYDLETKYQGKAQRLLQDAMNYMRIGLYNYAESSLREAQELAANNLYILKVWAHLALMQDDLANFNRIFEKIEEIAPESKKYLVLLNKASMLIDDQRPEQTLRVVKKIESLFPDKKPEMIDIYLAIYDQQSDFNKIWDILSDRLKTMEDYNDDNLRIFINAVALINKYEQWDKKEFLINETRSLIESIKENEEIRNTIIGKFQQELEEAEEYDAVKSQLLYTDLILLLKDDPHLLAKREKLKLMAKISQELEKMAEDQTISPFVFYRGARLYYRWAYPEQDPDIFVDFPSFFEMKMFKEDHVKNYSAIKVLEDKYPAIFELFKNEWLKIKKDSYNSLNSRQLSLFEKQLKIDENSDYDRLDSGQIVNKNKVGRNDPCPCGSGKKYKKCCGR
ncbi:MAG: hypothetical protein PWR10_1034 [Halanaerobiales bacterium]|nr:hypothetical protein [Halanaerobiales bacterium]